MRGDLRKVLVGDFGGRLVHDLLEAKLAPSLIWRECGQALLNGHQVTRAEERMPVDEVETSFLFTRVCVSDCRLPQEGLKRISAQSLWIHHCVALQQAHIVEKDLTQAL